MGLAAVLLATVSPKLAVIAALLLVARIFLGPYLLRTVFSGVAASSVSLRSIKGLSISRSYFTLEIDRVGLVVHLLGSKANRTVGLTFEGVKLTVLRGLAKSSQQKRRPRRRNTLYNQDEQHAYADISPVMEWMCAFLPEAFVFRLDRTARRWIRNGVQTAFAFVILAGPTIVSTLSISFTSLHIVFMELNGATVTVSDASFGVGLNLESVPSLKMTEEERIKLREAQRLALKSKTWKDRFVRSMGRTWEAAWKGTKGTGSAFVTFGQLTVCRPSQGGHKINLTDSGISLSSVPVSDIAMDVPEDAVLHIPGATRLSVSCQFDPQAGGIT